MVTAHGGCNIGHQRGTWRIFIESRCEAGCRRAAEQVTGGSARGMSDSRWCRLEAQVSRAQMIQVRSGRLGGGGGGGGGVARERSPEKTKKTDSVH